MSKVYDPAIRAAADLELLLEFVKMDTSTLVESGEPAGVAVHLEYLRFMVKELDRKVTALSNHVKEISEHMMPTLMFNKGMKSTTFIGVGRVAINQHWTAKMLNPPKCMEWLRAEGNGGVIRETVHHETLGAIAREAATKGHWLPHDLFNITTSNYTSITKV